MGDEGRDMAVLGRNFDLLVDHGDCSRLMTPVYFGRFPWGIRQVRKETAA
jgi:hypothetical protein